VKLIVLLIVVVVVGIVVVVSVRPRDSLSTTKN